jgi:RecA/RadA recombinase
VQFKANGTTIESGVLLSIGLTDLALKIGTDEFGVSITQGSVAIASLAPTTAGDTRRWLAVVADNVTASVNAGVVVVDHGQRLGRRDFAADAGRHSVAGLERRALLGQRRDLQRAR